MFVFNALVMISLLGKVINLEKYLRRIPLNVRAISAKEYLLKKTTHSTVTFSMLFETSHSSSLDAAMKFLSIPKKTNLKSRTSMLKTGAILF